MPKNSNPRLLLAKLRNGDYAHAGETEAIDIVLKKLNELKYTNNISAQNILDVGCGLGGTADYIQKATHANVSGVDIDSKAIQHAKSKYTNNHFYESDIMEIDKLFTQNKFDLIYLFNVLYCIPKQKESLRVLSEISNPGAILVIFDYTSLSSSASNSMKDLSGKPMNPLVLTNLYTWLDESGWKVLETQTLNDKYEEWYMDFLIKLSKSKDELLKIFSQEAFINVYNTFSTLLNKIKNKEIGGSVIYTRSKKSPFHFFKGPNDNQTNPLSGNSNAVKIKSKL